MRIKIVTLASIAFFSISATCFAQGIGEYGRLMGGVKEKSSGAAPQGGTRSIQPNTTVKSRVPVVNDRGGEALPKELTVEVKESALFSRSEDWADKIGQVSQGEKLIPMLRATGAQVLWYLVKTEAGTVGWVKASDVRAIPAPN